MKEDDFNTQHSISAESLSGFIDFQVNGGGGHLFNDDPSLEKGEMIANAHAEFGTSEIFLTLITDHPKKMKSIFEIWADPKKWPKHVAGIHFEGPFISPQKPGVHPTNQIRKLSEKDVKEIISFQEKIWPKRILLTLAPEECEDEFIKSLSQTHIILAAGHSQATYEQAMRAFDNGVSGVTHFGNAMSGMSARKPGLMGAALEHTECWVSCICDGHHLHPMMIDLLYNRKGSKMISVSDAMPLAAKGGKSFILNGEIISKLENKSVTSKQALAGSAITQREALSFLVDSMGWPEKKALALFVKTPAEILRNKKESFLNVKRL